jgi:hypothetical protein
MSRERARTRRTVAAALLAAAVLLTPVATRGAPPPGCDRWVAPPPAGDDANPGTAARPWATLAHAASEVDDARCTVWFANGTYSGPNKVRRRFSTPTVFRAAEPYRAVFEHDDTVLVIGGARNLVFQGLRLRHAGPGSGGLLAYVDQTAEAWTEHVTFRDNIFHDSHDDDLLKLHDGARFVTVTGNVFYNQGDGEEQIDVNGVTDVVIQDNVFFNDLERSGRTDRSLTKHAITVKDSNGGASPGSRRITIRRNVFLNWQGGAESFVSVGNDGKPYHEAVGVRIENNLFLGNSAEALDAAFTVSGARDVVFVNNTVTGDLPAAGYAFRVYTKRANPPNDGVLFANNIWSDPTGTMGASGPGDRNDFANGRPGQTAGLVLDTNLYWNGGAAIPAGEPVDPLVADTGAVIGDPQLSTAHDDVAVPYWTGVSFLSGNLTIRDEFERLVMAHAAVPAHSPALGRGAPALAPVEDILGRARPAAPSIGAFDRAGQ